MDRLLSKENITANHRNFLENDLYDDREACIGSLVNKSCLPLETPVKKSTSEAYNDFHLLWNEFGEDPLLLAERYSLLTEEYLSTLPRQGRPAGISHKKLNESSVFEAVDLERSIWQLVRALYEDRICHSATSVIRPTLKPLCHSEKDIVNNLYDIDDDLRETQIVVDWLEGKVREGIAKVAEKYECLFNEIAVWENTRHLLEIKSRDELRAKGIVSQLFPDSPYVGDGSLAQKDIEDENCYLNYLFLCVRAGDMQRAQRLCLQRGDITRAVAMEGWRPFHSSYLSEDTSRPEKHVVEGNASRVLSKCVAWWNAENPALNAYERAMFAVQSGNLAALLQNMTSGSWEDLLWAHCRTLVESRVDATIRTRVHCGPRADTLSVIGRPQKDLELSKLGLELPDDSWIPGSWSLADAFTKTGNALGWSSLDVLFRATDEGSVFVAPPPRPSEIAAFLSRGVLDTTMAAGDAKNTAGCRQTLLQALFYFITRGVALREYTDLLTGMASMVPRFIPPAIREVLSAGVVNAQWPDRATLDDFDCQVLRFLAHLVLCLRRLETHLPEEPCNAILEAYVIALIVERRYALVASYVAQLSSRVRQVRWYASFLASLKKPEDRRRCIDYAGCAGLPVPSITRAVIRIMQRRFDSCEVNAPQPPLPHPITGGTRGALTEHIMGDEGTLAQCLTHTERARIAALDWLTYDRAQRGELLVLANSVLRLFVAMDNLRAARALLEHLPVALLDQLKLSLVQAEEEALASCLPAPISVPPWLSNSIREHECLCLFLQAREAFDQWYVHVNLAKPTPPNASISTDNLGSLAERVAAEEAERNYQARLECWNHEVDLSTSALMKQLKALLTYDEPGWLVDATVVLSGSSVIDCDATGMFGSSPFTAHGDEPQGEGANTADAGEEEDAEDGGQGGGGLGIAGLGVSPHYRRMQMGVLREKCLREVVFMLLKVLKLTHRHAECVQLADLVADSQLCIFEVFKQVEMMTLLEEIHDSMLRLQAECDDPLGFDEATASS